MDTKLAVPYNSHTYFPLLLVMCYEISQMNSFLEIDQLDEDLRDRRRIEVCRRFVTEHNILDVGILRLQRMRGSPSDITGAACSLLVEWSKTQVDQQVSHSQIRDALQDTLKPILKQVCLRIDFVQHGSLKNQLLLFS